MVEHNCTAEYDTQFYTPFNVLDWIAVVGYFIVVLAVGLWASFRPNKGSNAGYFLAGKSMHWVPVGASLFATNIGAPMFIGLAGGAAAGGIASTLYEWEAGLMLLLLGWVFMPVYTSSESFTMPEYLGKRFGSPRIRLFYSIVSIFLITLRNMPGELYAGIIFLEKILEWPLFASIGLILAITAVFTIAGGLAAVIYTDTLQTVILIIGTIFLAVVSLFEVGGLDALWYEYPKAFTAYTAANNLTCGMPRDDAFHMLRHPIDADLPWPGMTFGLSIVGGIWYMDQLFVQRVLSAKNVSHAKAGTLLASYLKLLPFFLFIIPGMISRVLHKDIVACSGKKDCYCYCNNEASCSNFAYPLLVVSSLPIGVRGIIVAALLSALVSTLTSVFNSVSTLFTVDVYAKFRPNASEMEQGFVGRIFIVIVAIISVAWLPIMKSPVGSKLWDYFQTIASCITPSWITVFLLGVFWPRATEQGAFWSLVVGHVAGLTRMVFEMFVYPPGYCEVNEPARNWFVDKIKFMNFAIILFIFSTVLMVVISLCTKPRTKEQLKRMTFWNCRVPENKADLQKELEILREEEKVVDEQPMEARATKMRAATSSSLAGKLKLKFVSWLCGISEEPAPQMSAEEVLLMRLKMRSVKENPAAKFILDINALLFLAIIIFLMVTFA